MANTTDAWPAGATWVFQGTVAEDATAGTHVCTLTVTPGAGNEMQVWYGEVQVGNTATAQGVVVSITDGTNELTQLANPASITAATSRVPFPAPIVPVAGTQGITPAIAIPFIVSGTMRLILQVSTAAVSVTQTFAVVCRLKTSALPTATLADTVGTPTLTINTNKVF